MITAKTSESNFELVPAGNHLAICYQMIEIGTEKGEYQGKPNELYKARIVWELCNEKKVFDPAKGEQPFSIGKDYTLSMGEKATLRHDLESWRGKAFNDDEASGFDITKLIGKPCMLNVIHKTSKSSGKSYATISGVTPVPKGMPLPAQVNPSFVFSYDEWSDEKFTALPEWLRKRIEATPEFRRRMEQPVADVPFKDESNDDLPFW
jgi:hypothetical protein